MRKERYIFETRIMEYKERAQQALDIVNNTFDLFNSYGPPFSVYGKSALTEKCKDGFVEKAIESIINKAKSGGVCEDKLNRIRYKCRTIHKILSEPSRKTRDALKAYGRIMLYDSERFCFYLNDEKLQRQAMRQAEDLD